MTGNHVTSPGICQELIRQGFSLIPLIGKVPIEVDWPRWCERHRPWNAADFEGRNAGIACGPASGVVVVDIDDEQKFSVFLASGRRDLPETRVHITGSGKRHLLYAYPQNGRRYGNRSCRKHGFDIRGIGGQVVAPGSVHPATGRVYTIASDRPCAAAPEWLLQMALVERIPGSAPDGDGQATPALVAPPDIDSLPIGSEVKHLIKTGALQGERSEAGMKVICSLLGADLTDAAIRAVFDEWPIGEKYREKGGRRERWLSDEIKRGRNYIADSGIDGDEPEGNEQQYEQLHLTDMGNAARLVNLHGADLRYCQTWRTWLVWDGRRWIRDNQNRVAERAKAAVRDIYSAASRAAGLRRRENLGKHAVRSEADNRLTAMMHLAQSEETISVLPEHFDSDPWLLTVRNGTIDLRTGQLREHSRGELITRLAPVEHDPGAECKGWLEFLDTIMAGNVELVEFLQRAVGYSLTGDTREQVFFFLYGTGANGKSTFLDVIGTLAGDYAKTARPETILMKRSDAIPADLAELRGARFVPMSEIGGARALAEGLVKQITGGDRVTARFLYGNYFTYSPEYKIWLMANQRPVIRGTDHAIWRRVRLIPFSVTIPEGRRDKQLAEKLKAELPGILNWMIAGCLMWQKSGLGTPRRVTEATDAYRREMDPLEDFIEECCLTIPDATVTIGKIFGRYDKWCQDSSVPPREQLGKRSFSAALTEREFEKGRDPSTRQWTFYGIMVKP